MNRATLSLSIQDREFLLKSEPTLDLLLVLGKLCERGDDAYNPFLSTAVRSASMH